MEMGWKIKEKGEEKEWCEEEVGEILNIWRESIWKWELKKVYGSIDMVIKMSDVFDMCLDEVMKGEKEFKKRMIER